MNKTRYIFTAVLGMIAFSSCEERFEVNVEGRSPKMFVECLVGPQDSTALTIFKAVPVGAPAEDGGNFTIKNLSFTQNGTPLSLTMGEDQSHWFTKDPIIPGAQLEFSLDTKELEPVHATTTVPLLPGYSLGQEIIKTSDADYMQMAFHFDGVTETTKLGIAVMCHSWYEEEDGEKVYYDFDCDITTIQNESTFLGELSSPFRSVSVPYGDEYYYVAMIQGKDLEKDNFFHCAVYYSEENTYSVYLFAFSEEAFSYLNAEYYKQNNFLSILGLAPSSFAYTNVAGGYGFVGGINATECHI